MGLPEICSILNLCVKYVDDVSHGVIYAKVGFLPDECLLIHAVF